MSFRMWDNGLGIARPVRHRVFVSYHHARDQGYYDAFSRTFSGTYEAVKDNSLRGRINSADTDYVIRRIREEYISGTSCTIVLVGAETWGRKYVDWEIKATLEKGHGLIGVQLPTAAMSADNKIIVPSRLHDNIVSGFTRWIRWEQLTTSPLQLNALVADAKGRSSQLISNSRPRQLRNA